MRFDGMLNTFFSLLYIIFVAVSSVVLFSAALLIWVVTRWLDKRLILLNLFSSFWASLYIWCMPIWGIRVTGREKMDMAKSYVLVSNHQSQLDILLAYRLFFPLRWVSKAEVFSIPFIGWNMTLNGYVKLKRGDKNSVAKMMTQCERLLEKNISVMIFPEGTRSKTGKVKPFKPGAFILAKKMKKNILPLVINNTKDALPKHSMKLNGRHIMQIQVLDEIPYSVFENMSIEDTAKMVRSIICAHVTSHSHDELRQS